MARERSHGLYPVTIATLDLIKELVGVVPETSGGSRINDFIACVVFVCRDVFTGYQKWYYADLREKQEIGKSWYSVMLVRNPTIVILVVPRCYSTLIHCYTSVFFSAGLKCLEIFHGILNLKESSATVKTMDETFEVSFHNEGQETRFENSS